MKIYSEAGIAKFFHAKKKDGQISCTRRRAGITTIQNTIYLDGRNPTRCNCMQIFIYC
jgi:hypothetical protein